MILYYDRKGRAISQEEWLKKSETEKRVAEDADGRYWVSTVWLGLNHTYGDGPPLIFETMVFAIKNGKVDFSELYCDRYSTEEEALEGHQVAVDLYLSVL